MIEGQAEVVGVMCHILTVSPNAMPLCNHDTCLNQYVSSHRGLVSAESDRTRCDNLGSRYASYGQAAGASANIGDIGMNTQ